LAGFGAVYLLVILVSYVPIGIDPQASVPTQWFPYLFPLAVFCQILARSVAILVQYGRGLPPPPHLSYDRKTQGRDEAAGGNRNE